MTFHPNSFIKEVEMRGNNMFYASLRKIILNYHQALPLIQRSGINQKCGHSTLMPLPSGCTVQFTVCVFRENLSSVYALLSLLVLEVECGI